MSKGSILAIDDDKFFRKLYEGIMLSEGFTINTSENGKNGIDLLKEQSFDVVIVDMIIPDWDGIKTIEEIRKVFPKQNIIMVTDAADLETAVEAMKSGANEYILKPFNNEQLVNTINRLINRDKIVLEHSKLMEESIENFEILSTHKKCIDILSHNEYNELVESIVCAMTAETGAQKGFLWQINLSAMSEAKVLGRVSVAVLKKAKLPVDNTSWKMRVKEGVPFLLPQGGQGSLFVPILSHDDDWTVAELSSKRGNRSFATRDLKTTAILASASKVALLNAEKIKELEESSIVDSNLKIYTFALFNHYLKKQFDTACRYGRPFSIVYMSVHNMDEMIESFGHEIVEDGIARLVGLVMNVIRDADVMSKKGEGEFYIHLSETDYFGSIMALKRIEDGIAGAKFVSDGETSMLINLALTSVSYRRDGSNIETLLNTARERSETLKESLFQRLELSEKGLWDSIDAILDEDFIKNSLNEKEESVLGAAGVYPDFCSDFYGDLCPLLVDEVLLRPYLRGILFIGMEKISPGAGFCQKIAATEDLATRVFVLGKKGREKWNIPNVTPVYLKEKESPLDIIVFLNEETGYIFLGKKGKKKYRSFHSSDIYLVEKIISRLRDHYLLQWI